jgi:NlpC/P60 family putative phage cell wall peptidase
MTSGADVVAEARTWISTPWQHQCAVKGVATDCLGLISGVGLALELPGSDQWRADARMRGYARVPDGRMIVTGCNEYLEPVSGMALQLGDIVLMRMYGAEPQHFAIVSSIRPARIIHAFAAVGRVVENGLDTAWRERILRAYRYKGLK